jgi:hypothetical protein
MLTGLKFDWYCANQDWYLDYRAKNTPWYWARKSPVGYYPFSFLNIEEKVLSKYDLALRSAIALAGYKNF